MIGSIAAPGAQARVATESSAAVRRQDGQADPHFRLLHADGARPPFSDFFLEVLRAYGLELLHLTPRTILDLSVFAYVCEAFIGVAPSVALFRH